MKNNYPKNAFDLFFNALSVILFGLLSTTALSQWSTTNASNATNNSFTGFIEHNGNLYSSSYEGLKKWNAGTETWNDVPFTGFTNGTQEFIQQMATTGSHIYVTKWNPYCQSNIVYKSADNGLTFVTDTVGLPRAPGCSDTITGAILSLFGLPTGRIVAQFGNQFYAKTPSDPTWVIDNTLARGMLFKGNNWYKVTSAGFFKSPNLGQSWQPTPPSSLLAGYQPTALAINSVTNRIYMNGFNFNFDNRFFYTDNEGTTWDTLPSSSYLVTSWLGSTQNINKIIAKGNYMVFGAEQNSIGSHADVYISTDGGITASLDTVGLSPNASVETVLALQYFNDDLFMAFTSDKIYRKGGIVGLNDAGSVTKVSLYPNPTQNKVYLKSDHSIDKVTVYDLQGNLIHNSIWYASPAYVDLGFLENGIYLLKIEAGDQEFIRRIIKQS